MATGLFILRRRIYFPTSIFIMLYNCLINSKLTYCIEAWGNEYNTNLEKIHGIEKIALHIIFRTSFNKNSPPFFQKPTFCQSNNSINKK